MESKISEILKTFSTTSLQEMESVKLMDRTDTKFVFHICRLPGVLNEMTPYYKVLEVNGVIPNRYETLYFDYENLDLYRQHHNGRSSRYKIRYRQYVDSELTFFEIKFRSNKGRTIKERVKRKRMHEEIEGKAETFLVDNTPLNPEWLKPQLWIYYRRMTFVNKTAGERLTIDFDLSYKDHENKMGYPNLVIAEVKQEKAKTSPFISIMRRHRLSSDSISKYCLGILSIKKNVKINRFKMKLRTINRICHEKN